MTFQEANKVVHKVEDQWEYYHLIIVGYKPLDTEKVGFVRSYRYKKGDEIITYTTGANADYWSSTKAGVEGGYWGDLLEYLRDM